MEAQGGGRRHASGDRLFYITEAVNKTSRTANTRLQLVKTVSYTTQYVIFTHFHTLYWNITTLPPCGTHAYLRPRNGASVAITTHSGTATVRYIFGTQNYDS